jgi:CHAT domain-containing protein/tetratricopeptide (TPR) repeat protein
MPISLAQSQDSPKPLSFLERLALARRGAQLNKAALEHLDRGEYELAVATMKQAHSIAEQLYSKLDFPDGHPNLASSLNNLGSVFQARRDYVGARGYYERALAMGEVLYPKDRYPHGHPDLATNLHNLGSLLQAQGDYVGARGYYQRDLAMTEALYPQEKYPQGHPELALSLNNLGVLLRAQGDYGGARGYLQRALEMREALYPKQGYPQGHPDLAQSLNNPGGLLQAQEDYGGARGYLQRALEMREALYPKERYPQGHPELALSLNNLGGLLQAQGDYVGARGYYRRALEMREALYPTAQYPQGHPELAQSLNNLGNLLEAEGKLTAALPMLQRAVDMYQDEADSFQGAVSEAESYDYLALSPGTIAALLSVSCRLPDQAEATYARFWRVKAAVARAIQRRQAALTFQASSDTRARQKLESWRDVRRQLARLLLATANGRDDPGRLLRLQRLTAEKERLERELAEALPEFARQQALTRSSHTRLLEQLPAGTVVLDLVAFKCSKHDPQVKGKQGEHWTPSYAGFVLAKGQPVRLVDLGPAGPIDEAVRTWPGAIVHRQPSPAAEVVRRRAWEPLAKHFPPGTTTVIITPDGRLTAVPWAALPGDRPGTVLLEQYTLATVPHAPFLLDRLTASPRSPGEGDLVLALGGVDYDQAPKPLNDAAVRTELLALRRAETERGRGPADGDRAGWTRLRGTVQEVEAVAERAGSRPLLKLRGSEASTARLLRELPRARWAHLATHGFFADPSIRSILQPDPKLFAFEGSQRVAGLRSPLVLSGLVLAGANRPASAVPQDDPAADDLGIVTAEAIAGLPLPGLELAVLSACETGLGLGFGGGEGVFGLQRAFHLAGTHNVVASLWRVDDQATAALMAIFYDQLWQQGQPPIAALRTAQLTLYYHPERTGELAQARGTPDFKTLVSRPLDASSAPAAGRRGDARDWAAFILSGWGR